MTFQSDAEPGAFRPQLRLEADLEYGKVLRGVSFFTPYSGVTLTSGGQVHFRLGSRWNLGGQFDLRLGGERRQGSSTAEAVTDHRILLEGELRF